MSDGPQESILEPLIFIIFINDLPKSVWNQIAMAMFADDAKCYRAVQSVEDGNSFQLNFDNIVKWCRIGWWT